VYHNTNVYEDEPCLALDVEWSENYASQPEIWAYMKNVAKKHDLYTHIRFETQVQKLTWDENQRKWIASLLDMNSNRIEEEVFDVVYVHRQ
jgi:cation diffusion facilitator CzcD-associated flavoprotein CzcO